MHPDQRHPELGNLTSLNNAAVDILLTGSTITDVAGKIDVTRRTLHRSLTDDSAALATQTELLVQTIMQCEECVESETSASSSRSVPRPETPT